MCLCNLLLTDTDAHLAATDEALQAWVEGLATATGNAGPGLALGSVALQGAILGALASVVAQVCTTPVCLRSCLLDRNFTACDMIFIL